MSLNSTQVLFLVLWTLLLVLPLVAWRAGRVFEHNQWITGKRTGVSIAHDIEEGV